jgi:hypothetical protein
MAAWVLVRLCLSKVLLGCSEILWCDGYCHLQRRHRVQRAYMKGLVLVHNGLHVCQPRVISRHAGSNPITLPVHTLRTFL